MKVVILAGGLGTRISEESHLRPKPMIEIGGDTLASAYDDYVNKLNTYKHLIAEQNKSIKIIQYFRFFTFLKPKMFITCMIKN